MNPRRKYPRTPHLPWSPGATEDDKVLKSLAAFAGRRVIVTEKMDGENTSLYPDGYVHARSLDSAHHPSRDWVKGWWAGIASGLPEGWRVCGENMYARHAIGYDALPSYFLGFSIWNEDDVALSWDDTTTWFGLLGIVTVPVLFDGVFDEAAIRCLYDEARDREVREGYVVRVADQIPMDSFTVSVAKYVRPNHVAADAKHWRTAPVVPNGLAR